MGCLQISHGLLADKLAYLIMEQMVGRLQEARGHHIIGAQAALCERLAGQYVARQVSQGVAVIQIRCKSQHGMIDPVIQQVMSSDHHKVNKHNSLMSPVQ